MNDFSELEAELKKLRPRAASADLTARIERGLAEVSGRTATAGVLPKRRNIRVNWFGLGLGLAAAATLLLLARLDVDQPPGKRSTVVAMTPVPFAQPVPVKACISPRAATNRCAACVRASARP
jgi:hypothetical protein